MLTIGVRGLKAPTERAHTGRYSPLGCGAGVGPKAEVLLGASFRNGLLCSEHKICVEREVEGASSRGDGLSDGEFWGTNEAGFGGVTDVGGCGVDREVSE